MRKLRSEERSLRNHLTENDSQNLESPGVKDSVGSYLEKIGRCSRLTDHQVRILAKRIRERGDINARNLLVLHNLKLVVWVAKKYINRCSPALGFMDIIQEGNIGLTAAVEAYDPDHFQDGGVANFSAYATYWIKQRIQRAIDVLSEGIRVPVHKCEERRKISGVVNKLQAEFGYKPGTKEMAEALGISEAETQKKLFQAKSALNLRSGTLVSLDLEVLNEKYGDPVSLANQVEDSSRLEPLQFLIAKEELARHIKEIKLLSKLIRLHLNDRNKLIFEMRYGINDDFEVRTLEYIGQKFSLTRERIRQLLDNQIWPKIKIIGINQDDLWMRHKIQKIRVLQNLVGEEGL